MATNAIKKPKNGIWEARLNAAEFNPAFHSREGAAEALLVDPRTLAAYELGERSVPSDILLRMVDIYNAPGLLQSYCAQECLIGRALNKQSPNATSLSQVAVQVYLQSIDTIKIHDQLATIVADGEISDSESDTLEDIVRQLMRWMQVSENACITIQNALKERRDNNQ